MENKSRSPWIAGILSFFVIGLGHLYSGKAKKGIFLYFFCQGLGLAIFLPLIYFFTSIPILMILVVCVVAFYLFCIIDAVNLAKQNWIRYTLKRYNKWYVYLGCWVLASFIIQPILSLSIKEFFIQAYKIPASSLEPTILEGDHILAKKLIAVKAGINKGDMIIFPFPEDTSKDYIKRVVAIGGETIEIVNKEVFINGKLIQEPYVIYSDPEIIPKNPMPGDNFGPVTVPDSALFVMGDNRDHSYDSRFWGFVEKAAVKGKAYTIYWSWDRENFKVRWNRIGMGIE